MDVFRLSPSELSVILSGATTDPETGLLNLSVEATQILLKESERIFSERKKRIRKTRKEKKKINEKTDIEILYHVKRNPNIAISKLSLDLGYSINALRNNEHTRTLFERYQKMFIVQPKMDNDHTKP